MSRTKKMNMNDEREAIRNENEKLKDSAFLRILQSTYYLQQLNNVTILKNI
jgi:hypothetical protein